MSQFKKEELRVAILKAAHRLFKEKGYANTTIGEIAKKAGMATGNVYHYFDSKFDILIAIFQPWIEGELDKLERRLEQIRSPRERLREVLFALWRDIPKADNGFHSNLIQALATKRPEERYSRAHLLRVEGRLASLIRPALPVDRQDVLGSNALMHLAMMASDGFTIGHKLVGEEAEDVSYIVDMTCDLLLPRPPSQSRRRSAPGKRRNVRDPV